MNFAVAVFKCQYCEAAFRIDIRKRGNVIICPKCKTCLDVPQGLRSSGGAKQMQPNHESAEPSAKAVTPPPLNKKTRQTTPFPATQSPANATDTTNDEQEAGEVVEATLVECEVVNVEVATLPPLSPKKSKSAPKVARSDVRGQLAVPMTPPSNVPNRNEADGAVASEGSHTVVKRPQPRNAVNRRDDAATISNSPSFRVVAHIHGGPMEAERARLLFIESQFGMVLDVYQAAISRGVPSPVVFLMDHNDDRGRRIANLIRPVFEEPSGQQSMVRRRQAKFGGMVSEAMAFPTTKAWEILNAESLTNLYDLAVEQPDTEQIVAVVIGFYGVTGVRIATGD